MKHLKNREVPLPSQPFSRPPGKPIVAVDHIIVQIFALSKSQNIVYKFREVGVDIVCWKRFLWTSRNMNNTRANSQPTIVDMGDTRVLGSGKYIYLDTM